MIRKDIYRFTDAHRFYLVLGCLILIAWGLLIVLQMSAHREVLDHEAMEHQILPTLVHVIEYLFGWLLMTVAMMLPGSLNMLKTHIEPKLHQVPGKQLVGLTVVGYMLPWLLFGLLVYLGDSLLHWIFEPDGALGVYSGWIAPAILMVAGAYQLTPFKRTALSRCKASHLATQYHHMERLNFAGILRQGLRLGMHCVANCWPLMLVMFALGHNRFEWMLVLSTVMTAERVTPWDQRIAWATGVVLTICSVAWILLRT